MKTTWQSKSEFSKIIIPALTGFSTLLIGIGIGRFGYPPLIPALVKEGWFTISQADYLGASNLTGYIIGSAFATWINKHISFIPLIRISLLTVVLMFILCAFQFNFFIYFILRLITGIAGGIIMVLTAPTIFKHSTTTKKGLLGGIIFSGVGIGIALAGTLIPFLIHQGLKTTWFVFAGISFLLVIFFWTSWPDGSNEKQEFQPSFKSGIKHSIWSKTIVLLLISYVCNAVGFVPHTVFWVDFISRGLDKGLETGTNFWILLGLSAAIGPVITGLMADKFGFSKSIRISLFIKGIGVVMPIFSTSTWSLAISSIFVGSLALGISSLAAGRVTEIVAPDLQKKLWSWMTIGFSITHALTAYVLTYIFSVTDSYYLLFKIGALTLIIGCVLDFIASKTTSQDNLTTQP
ncbi:MAG: YbfB/YjiJ family MFS transporter [Pedobacter sp.]|jgi:predicted MFS family arabinose efflux permease|uniref:YbfB/YjiJ family MFS transporter n=1 Tax=Pedobacter sp. TaxID=1411316 RepID=UPI00356A0798